VKKTLTIAAAAVLLGTGLSACTSAADQADKNLSKAAENFEVPRRIVGINAITDKVLFSVEGYCSYETDGDTIDVICATQDSDRKGHVSRTTLGKSDNVTFVSTQLADVEVDFFRPRIIFRPETILPDFDLSTSVN
jgi:protein involved in sex pheromone biosynthesis